MALMKHAPSTRVRPMATYIWVRALAVMAATAHCAVNDDMSRVR
jgi:hypothetical protein